MHDVLFVVVPTRMPRRLGSLLRCRAGLANRCAELIKFALRTVQLAIDNLQTHDAVSYTHLTLPTILLV